MRTRFSIFLNLRRAITLVGTCVALVLGGCQKISGGFEAQSKLVAAPVSSVGNSFASALQANLSASDSVKKKYSADQLQKALRIAAIVLVSRNPTGGENAAAVVGISGYESVIQSYLEDPAFSKAQLAYYRGMFGMGGMGATADDLATNYDEPANLATYLAAQNHDFREVLTATYCVKNDLSVGPCAAFGNSTDLAKAQGAGVITTQGYLRHWAMHYNFRRVKHVLEAFECHDYPDATDQGMTAKEVAGTVETFNCGASGGCTPVCLNCHRNLNPRASLFYTFDQNGSFRPKLIEPNSPDATNSALVTLRADGKASTLSDILVAGTVARYHGRNVTSLQEFGSLVSQSKGFRDCLAQHLVNMMTGAQPLDAMPAAYQDIRDHVQADGFQVKKLLLEIAEHPAFVLRQN